MICINKPRLNFHYIERSGGGFDYILLKWERSIVKVNDYQKWSDYLKTIEYEINEKMTFYKQYFYGFLPVSDFYYHFKDFNEIIAAKVSEKKLIEVEVCDEGKGWRIDRTIVAEYRSKRSKRGFEKFLIIATVGDEIKLTSPNGEKRKIVFGEQ